MRSILILVGLLAAVYGGHCHTSENTSLFLYHLRSKPAPGDGIHRLLARYYLPTSSCNVEEFCRLNQISSSHQLQLDRNYLLPIQIYRYNGSSIRSTLGNSDYAKAKRIQVYNEHLLANKVRKTDYRKSLLLWVPHHELACGIGERRDPLLGSEHEVLTSKSNKLKGRVFFLVAGHGGPDPGALGKSQGTTLCEDEYAYDVTLRLYKLILEHGGQAEMIIKDPDDGIRDGRLLNCDQDERCNGQVLPINQLKRLRQRVDYINTRFKQLQQQGIRDQTCLSIHVDSRSSHQRQDVFFCHYGLSKGGRQVAHDLHRTFAAKYRQHRKSGKYQGSIESRSLFVLKNTMPKAVLIELANIRNTHDHRRILLSSNRQALAQWIFEGLSGGA